MKRVYHFLPGMLLLASACTAEVSTNESQSQNDVNGETNVSVSAPDFVSSNDITKSTISTNGSFTWTDGDKIGIFPCQVGVATQIETQLALTLSAGVGQSAAYSSTVGWALLPGSIFNYFSYYPYSETNTSEQISINYTGQTQTVNNSTAGLGAYDYMYSDMTEVSSSGCASFSFHHIGCCVNVNITVPEGYESTTVYRMSLSADTEIFTSTATYSVNDINISGAPDLDGKTSKSIDISFGEAGIKPSGGVISAWLMMAPAQWCGKSITAKLYLDNINSFPTISGTFNPEANQTAGTEYAYSVTNTAVSDSILPERPGEGEQLHILLFGHSFGQDCMEYLPAITIAAGITNVHYGSFFFANCSLMLHWNQTTTNNRDTVNYYYYDYDPLTGAVSISHHAVDSVLKKYPWDIIVFQQCVRFNYDGVKFWGEGYYPSYQPHLNYLIQHVVERCETIHHKTPTIGWNMFWGFNSEGYPSSRPATHDVDATDMFKAIVKAAQDMTADSTKAAPVPLIIPTGTAIQNARCSSLNDPGSEESPSSTNLLTRDGHHLSEGIGRYTVACTWFQYLIAPIYGKTIVGNTFRPTRTSFAKDKVTDERAAICWQCVLEAVANPYEVNENKQEE